MEHYRQEQQVPEIDTSIRSIHPTVNLSRRRFLGNLAIGSVVIPAAIYAQMKQIEQNLYQTAAAALLHQGTSAITGRTLSMVGELAPDAENPRYRPLKDLIEESIQAYKNKGGKPHYHRSPSYNTMEYYSNKIRRYPAGIAIKNPLGVVNALTKDMTGSAKEAYNFSDTNFSTYIQLFPDGSGFHNRLRQQNPQTTNLYNLASRYGPQEINEARIYIEQEVAANGQPVSSSKLLEYYLDKNNGDIGASIYDTTIFLKAMARSIDEHTGATIAAPEQVEWYRRNLLDEFQGSVYSDAQNSSEAGNLIGKPYHAFNQAMLLSQFPTPIVMAGVTYRQLQTFSAQGIEKSRNDIAVMNELEDIDTLLMSYAANSQSV